MAKGQQEHSLAQADRFAELPADVTRLAAGPQWLLPSGSRLHRPRREQEGRRGADLFAARCKLPSVGGESLPAQPQLHQFDCRRKAAGVAVARHRISHAPLHGGCWNLAMGQQ